MNNEPAITIPAVTHAEIRAIAERVVRVLKEYDDPQDRLPWIANEYASTCKPINDLSEAIYRAVMAEVEWMINE